MGIEFLVDLAIILLSTKALGVLTRKFQLPQVVGALLAGLILGPAVLGIIHGSTLIHDLAEIGVIIIMFCAGTEVDLKELKKAGKAAIAVAIMGVLLPLLGGYLVSSAFNLSFLPLMKNIFLGVILTATSVSITVETLQEMGKLKTRAGTIILGAAIIDDVLGLVILTIMMGISGDGAGGSIGGVLLKIVLFFFVAIIIGIPISKFFNSYSKVHKKKRRFPIFAFAFCLFLAFIGERYFGVADIAGAFIAGLIISTTVHSGYIHRRFEILSYMFLTPIFFASVGISIEISHFSMNLVWLALAITAVAVLTKVTGGVIGAKLTGSDNKEALRIGIGMVARSEVALIVTNKGVAAGIISATLFAPIAIMVIVTSILTPILLKLVFTPKKHKLKKPRGKQDALSV
ncbi:MAG: cation:proton antiporter [Clostridiales bacterium]|nr:cation:proton antiporter [Clostridiales bacterium]